MRIKPYSKAAILRHVQLRKKRQQQTRRAVKLFDEAIKEYQ